MTWAISMLWRTLPKIRPSETDLPPKGLLARDRLKHLFADVALLQSEL